MLERATPEQAEALAEHLRRDAAVDAEAIRLWRQARAGALPGISNLKPQI